MKKYETVIHIVTTGEDMYDAGEKAGQLITEKNLSGEDLYIYCDPTKPYHTKANYVRQELACKV